MRIKSCKLLAVLVLTLLLASHPVPALANSAPPPQQIWLRFVNTDGSKPGLQAVQFLGCAETACENPTLLKSYGNCRLPGCLAASPSLSKEWTFGCASNRCLFTYDHWRIDEEALPAYMQIIIQTSAGVFTGNSFANPGRKFNSYFLGTLAPGGMNITEDPDITSPGYAYENFFETYLLTLLVELSISAILAGVWLVKELPGCDALPKCVAPATQKGDSSNRSGFPKFQFLFSVFLANLFSYPVAWLLIPSFGQFQYGKTRIFGLVLTAGVLFYTVAAIGLSFWGPKNPKPPYSAGNLKPGKFWSGHKDRFYTSIRPLLSRNRRGIGAFFLVLLTAPMAVGCSVFIYGLAYWGGGGMQISGLNTDQIIAIAEVFAVLFETAFISILGRKYISPRQTFVVCLLANAASYLLGVILF